MNYVSVKSFKLLFLILIVFSCSKKSSMENREIAINDYLNKDAPSTFDVYTKENAKLFNSISLIEEMDLKQWNLAIYYLTINRSHLSGVNDAQKPNMDVIANVIIHTKDKFFLELFINFLLKHQGGTSLNSSLASAKVFKKMPLEYLLKLSKHYPESQNLLIKNLSYGLQKSIKKDRLKQFNQEILDLKLNGEIKNIYEEIYKMVKTNINRSSN